MSHAGGYHASPATLLLVLNLISFWCIVLVSQPFDESVTGIAFANLTTNSFGITLEEVGDYDDDDEEQAIQPPT